MTKFNLEKCKSGNKGITLIALIITIIVLLILAGITIASLTGSDSAPAKANEAKQRNDIGSAKDQLAVVVQNAHLEAYDDIYVAGNETVKSTAANTTVGQRVINAALEKYGASKNMKFGDASIVVAQSAEGQDATVTITTRDFTETGKISIDGGVLTWDATPAGGGDDANLSENSVQKLAQAGKIKRWDKISNYDPGTTSIASVDLPEGAKIEGTKLASVSDDLPSGASLSGTVTANQITDWMVLDVNPTTGEVLIMPDASSQSNTYAQLTLSGKDGYNNAIEALNTVAGVYANPTYANSARSLTVEDVNKVENHTPDGDVEEKSWTHNYGMDENLNITGSDDATATSQTYNSTATTGYYSYSAPSFGVLGDFWLASRYVDLRSSGGACGFDVRNLDNGIVLSSSLFVVKSNGSAYADYSTYSVLPVVSLKSTVQLTQGSAFYTETETATESVAEDPGNYVTHYTWSIQ